MNITVSQPPRVKSGRAAKKPLPVAGSGKNNTEAGMANRLTCRGGYFTS